MSYKMAKLLSRFPLTVYMLLWMGTFIILMCLWVGIIALAG